MGTTHTLNGSCGRCQAAFAPGDLIWGSSGEIRNGHAVVASGCEEYVCGPCHASSHDKRLRVAYTYGSKP